MLHDISDVRDENDVQPLGAVRQPTHLCFEAALERVALGVYLRIR
jgi:hypothetical protein